MTTQHPEALRLADELDAVPETGADPQTIQEAAAELRRQHARIAELEARIKTMAEEHADELMVAHLDGRMRAEQAIPGVQWQCGPQANGFTAPQADSQPAGADRHGLPPLPDPDLRDVGTNPEDIKNFLRGYATEYAKAALASSAPADSVLEDAARLTYEQAHAIRQGHEISASDGYFEARPQIDSSDRRKVFQAGFERGWDAARKQGETNEH